MSLLLAISIYFDLFVWAALMLPITNLNEVTKFSEQHKFIATSAKLIAKLNRQCYTPEFCQSCKM
jgi:hypothetical protein